MMEVNEAIHLFEKEIKKVKNQKEKEAVMRINEKIKESGKILEDFFLLERYRREKVKKELEEVVWHIRDEIMNEKEKIKKERNEMMMGIYKEKAKRIKEI